MAALPSASLLRVALLKLLSRFLALFALRWSQSTHEPAVQIGVENLVELRLHGSCGLRLGAVAGLQALLDHVTQLRNELRVEALRYFEIAVPLCVIRPHH